MSKFRIAVFFVVLGTLIAGYAVSRLYFDDDAVSEDNQAASFSAAGPSFGGPFSLIDHSGKAVTDKDFSGSFMLVFFGYTSCPDVCPTELKVISDAMDILGEAGKKVQPLFITVDPERDTPEVLAGYVGAFHPRLIGLTGSAKQIEAAAGVFKAGYVKLEDPSPTKEKSSEYFMGHSSSTYLIGPDGKALFTFPRGLGPEELAKEVGKFIAAAAK
ncbi:MAG: hypothetical protein A3G18_05750 [Rhodospirillales bacterium RIFCSPLOWO2_12_FULL_58_28]|nr:MAG: hypothetical protein A3H92_00055 [Rhodospirillales bacterium RIFCSPLOWO2_02_FULL_58_16]OHC79289.1 MAG: hypothetical protein A3G18_05750 [Rhodospirillales bacterium RIFCSPLOWO2_12_FULL_58_28]